MKKKKAIIRIFVIIIFLFSFISLSLAQKSQQSGRFSIYFYEEKIGYEIYTWQSVENEHILSVNGKMSKLIPLEFEKLTIHYNKSFIPSQYHFKGSIIGVEQEITSTIVDGAVKNIIEVAGQKQEEILQIRRDAFLLPNPIFSPYMAITKKYKCLPELEEPIESSTYIIPQSEVPFTLEAEKENPCLLIIYINETEIKLETNQKGDLKTIYIPSQNLRVVHEDS
ncbi:MAG: hypothetical protein ACOC6P_02925 [Candidatus Aminicenantaceae bacterium]